jgi:hypothetical protein
MECLNLNYLQDAKVKDPQGAVCGFCNKPNDNADDVGFFYIVDARDGVVRDNDGHCLNKSLPACIKCYDIHIKKHQEIYGMGER